MRGGCSSHPRRIEECLQRTAKRTSWSTPERTLGGPRGNTFGNKRRSTCVDGCRCPLEIAVSATPLIVSGDKTERITAPAGLRRIYRTGRPSVGRQHRARPDSCRARDGCVALLRTSSQSGRLDLNQRPLGPQPSALLGSGGPEPAGLVVGLSALAAARGNRNAPILPPWLRSTASPETTTRGPTARRGFELSDLRFRSCSAEAPESPSYR